MFATLAQTFGFLGSPGAREFVELGADDVPFDAEEFLRRRDVALQRRAQGLRIIAPLFYTLTGLIYDTAKRLAQQNRSGRLDPPVLFALDEAPNVAPVAAASLDVRSARSWDHVCRLASSRASNSMTCGRPTLGSIIWNNSKVKMILLAVSEGETLDLVSKLRGTYEAERQTLSKDKEGNVSTSTVMETRPAFPPEAIRMLPDFTSLVLYGNHRPVKVSIDPFWERRSVKRALRRRPRSVPRKRRPRLLRHRGQAVGLFPNNCNRWRRSTSCRVTPERARGKSRVAADDLWEVLEAEGARSEGPPR